MLKVSWLDDDVTLLKAYDAFNTIRTHARKRTLVRFDACKIRSNLIDLRPATAAIDDELDFPRPRALELEFCAVRSVGVVINL